MILDVVICYIMPFKITVGLKYAVTHPVNAAVDNPSAAVLCAMDQSIPRGMSEKPTLLASVPP